MTKNILKVLKQTILTVIAGAALAAAFAPNASATNVQDAIQTAADATGGAGYALGGAGVVNALNLTFTGKNQAGTVKSSTGAYVTIAASAMTFYQPFGTLDTSVGTSGVITYASTLSANTLGALCDYLNALGKSYLCTLTGAKRDDPPKVLTTQTSTDGTNNLAAVGGFNVTQASTTYVSLGITPGTDRRIVLKQCQANGQGATTLDKFYVYGQLRKYGSGKDVFGATADDTYQVWGSSMVQNTSVNIPASGFATPFLEFARNAHVVVRAGIQNGTAVETGNNWIQCFWDER